MHEHNFKVTVTTQPPTTSSYLRAFYGADPHRLGDFCIDFINRVLQESDPIAYGIESRRKAAEEKARKKAMLELEKFKLELAIKELD